MHSDTLGLISCTSGGGELLVPLQRPIVMEPEKAACCWTCKIRHVKCDGTPNACTQCTSRHVQCHGYGPMPSWMDGGSNEAREKQRIKLAVKKNFRKKKRLQTHRSRSQDKSTSQERSPQPTVSEVVQQQHSDISQSMYLVITVGNPYSTY